MKNFCISSFVEKQKKEAYEIYITDCLRIITENTSHQNGKYISKRYYDLIHPEKQDKRSGAEIAKDVIKKTGINLIGKEDTQ